MQLAVLHHLETTGDDAVAAVYAEVAEQVRLADDLGFAIAWVAEHHFSTARGLVPEPLLFLLHLAGQTRSIRVGSAVLPAPFYHPLRLAESVALTDVLTGGRLACGISSSGVPDEMRAFGVSQDGKHDRLRESLRWLRRAWSGETIQLPDSESSVTIVPQPSQSVEDMVWVAASTEGAARVAGELGHHLLLPSLRPVPSSAAHVAAYRAELARILALPKAAKSGGDFFATLGVRVGKSLAHALVVSALESTTTFTEAMRLLGIKKLSTFDSLARRLGVDKS